MTHNPTIDANINLYPLNPGYLSNNEPQYEFINISGTYPINDTIPAAIPVYFLGT